MKYLKTHESFDKLPDEKRYVIFRVYAKNLFGNKKEITGGKVLDYFDTIEDIARSKYYLIDQMVEHDKRTQELFPGKHTGDPVENVVADAMDFLETRLKFGTMYHVGLEGLEDDEIKKLLTQDFHANKDKPVSHIILDTKKNTSSKERQWLRDIKVKSLNEDISGENWDNQEIPGIDDYLLQGFDDVKENQVYFLVLSKLKPGDDDYLEDGSPNTLSSGSVITTRRKSSGHIRPMEWLIYELGMYKNNIPKLMKYAITDLQEAKRLKKEWEIYSRRVEDYREVTIVKCGIMLQTIDKFVDIK